MMARKEHENTWEPVEYEICVSQFQQDIKQLHGDLKGSKKYECFQYLIKYILTRKCCLYTYIFI